MADHIVRKLDFVKKLSLSAPGWLIAAAIVVFGFAAQIQAQSPTANKANADPSFEVATIKPSPPNRPGKSVGFRGGHYMYVAKAAGRSLQTDLSS